MARPPLPRALALAALLCTAHAIPFLEFAALMDLYESTAGWAWAESWPAGDPSSDPCADQWFGVVCDPSNNTVM